MKDSNKTKKQLIEELEHLRGKMENSEGSSIRAGAEQALKEQAEKFESLFNGLNEPIFVHYLKAEGFNNFIEVNKAACRLFGYSREEFLQMGPADISSKDDVRRKGKQGSRERLRKEGSAVFEASQVTKAGRIFPVEISSNIYRHLGKDVILTIIRDISDRKEIEETRQRYEHILSSTDDLLVFVDQDYVYQAVNKAYLEAYGLLREEIIGHTVPNIIGEGAFREKVKDKIDQALAGSYVHYSSWFDFKAKGRRFVDVRYRPFVEADGSISGLVATIHDNTEIMAAEDSLRESEERLKLALRGADLGLYDWDIKSNAVVFNERWARMLGYSLDEIEPTAEGWSQLVHPDDLPRVMKELEDHLAGKSEFYETEHRMKTKSGEWKWILDRGRVIEKDDDGNPRRMSGTHLDINERVDNRREKEHLQQRLAQTQKIESIGRLAGGVAHDFNNMLAVILGHVDQALEQVESDQPVFQDLEKIKIAAERSADLTRQLLGFARKQMIRPNVFDLDEALAGALGMLRRLIGEQVDLSWQPSANPWRIRMDQGQVVQVLTNLCLNSRDSISGVGSIAISTRNTTLEDLLFPGEEELVSGEFIQLSVKDDGCGMDEETTRQAFEPFFTTKDAGQGTGLGLSTVHGIVKQNEGFIRIESEPGTGTNVCIFLPRHHGDPDIEIKTEKLPVSEKGEGTILLVEDEPLVLDLTRRMVRKLGYEVLAAGTPGQAIRMAREFDGEIRALITDIIMPEMNGEELSRRIKTLYPDIGLLFMSGYPADVISHQEALPQGAGFLAKPFTYQDLELKIREVLGGAT